MLQDGGGGVQINSGLGNPLVREGSCVLKGAHCKACATRVSANCDRDLLLGFAVTWTVLHNWRLWRGTRVSDEVTPLQVLTIMAVPLCVLELVDSEVVTQVAKPSSACLPPRNSGWY